MDDLDIEVFRAWLLDQGHEVVGYTQVPCSCPLAEWFEEMFGGYCEVFSGEYRGPDGAKRALPRWASVFVKRVDNLWAYCAHPVTGYEAADLLNGLP